MRLDNIHSLLTILVITVATWVTRGLPFAIFNDKKETSKIVTYLGKVLPFAIIGMILVYCLKSVNPLQYPYCLPEIISIAAIILVHKWKHNTLLSIGGGTILYMVLVQVVFK